MQSMEGEEKALKREACALRAQEFDHEKGISVSAGIEEPSYVYGPFLAD
jgi:hypothetical protein